MLHRPGRAIRRPPRSRSGELGEAGKQHGGGVVPRRAEFDFYSEVENTVIPSADGYRGPTIRPAPC